MRKSKNQLRREKKKLRKLQPESSVPGLGSGLPEHRPVGGDGVASTTFGAPSGETASQALMPPTTVASRSADIVLARKFEWINETSPLFEMYQQVSSRFKRRLDEDVPAHADGDGGDLEGLGIDPVMGFDPRDPEKDPGTVPSSRSAKPALVELKAATCRPELVEWFDCDARDPFYNVFLKTQPQAVQPPANWRARSEIPHFTVRTPYVLPASVARSGIAEACDSCGATGLQQGQLDVDYERMYAAFFPPGMDEPRTLSALGELPSLRGFALRRRVQPRQKPPMSARLRAALGLAPDEPPPWAAIVAQRGPPKGYATPSPPYKPWGAFLVD